MRKHIIYLSDTKFHIGSVGENNATTFLFNIKEWQKQFGVEGIPSLLVQRPVEGESAYPAIISLKDGYIEWIVSSIETCFSGTGKIQLQYVVNDTIVKSKEFSIVIDESLVEGTDVPKIERPWVDAVILAGQQAINAISHVPQIIPLDGSGTWHVWDPTLNKYIDTGIIAEGKNGKEIENYVLNITIPQSAWKNHQCAVQINDLKYLGYSYTISPQNNNDFISLFIDKIDLVDTLLDDTKTIYFTCKTRPTEDLHLQLTGLNIKNLEANNSIIRFLINYKVVESILGFIDTINEKERTVTYDGGSSSSENVLE